MLSVRLPTHLPILSSCPSARWSVFLSIPLSLCLSVCCLLLCLPVPLTTPVTAHLSDYVCPPWGPSPAPPLASLTSMCPVGPWDLTMTSWPEATSTLGPLALGLPGPAPLPCRCQEAGPGQNGQAGATAAILRVCADGPGGPHVRRGGEGHSGGGRGVLTRLATLQPVQPHSGCRHYCARKRGRTGLGRLWAGAWTPVLREEEMQYPDS